MKKLYRSRREEKIAGVCGGLGEFFNIDPTLIRLLVIFITIATGIFPMLLTYLVAWLVIPREQ